MSRERSLVHEAARCGGARRDFEGWQAVWPRHWWETTARAACHDLTAADHEDIREE